MRRPSGRTERKSPMAGGAALVGARLLHEWPAPKCLVGPSHLASLCALRAHVVGILKAPMSFRPAPPAAAAVRLRLPCDEAGPPGNPATRRRESEQR